MNKKKQSLSIETPAISPQIPFTIKWKIVSLHFIASAFINTIQCYSQGLQSNLLNSPYNFSNFEYGVFYGMPTFPNMFLPIFFGLYIDKYGINVPIIFFLESMVICGTLTLTLGSYYLSYSMMLCGQFMLGVGCENIQLMIKRFILKLSNKEESLKLFGFHLVAIRIATLLSSFLAPAIYVVVEDIPSTFAFTILLGSIICLCFNIGFYIKNNNGIKDSSDMQEDGLLKEDENMASRLKNFLKEANNIFWLVFAIVVNNFVMLYGLFSEANTLIMAACNVSSLEASYFLVFYSILAGIFQIILGFLFAKTGYYIYAMIFGASFQLIASVFFIEIFKINNEYSSLLPLSNFAIGYSLGTTFIFSSTAFIVDHKHLGVAYGVVQCGVNIGACFGSMLFGFIKDSSQSIMNGYFWPLVETAAFQIFNLFLAIVILFVDSSTLKVLSKKRN